MKYIGALNDGTPYAPKLIENRLKFVPYIKEAVAFGDGRDMVCALIDIDAAAVGRWADKRSISYTGHADLASQDEVYGLISDCIADVNAELAQDPALAKSQIHRFLILHGELSADDGVLTRTGKLRRGVIAERYRTLVDAMYGGRTEVASTSRVRPCRHQNPRREGRRARTSQECSLNISTLLQSSQRAFPDRHTCPRAQLDLAAVRRRQGADQHQLQCARARGAGDHRTERRRQELDAQRHQRRLRAAGRHHHPSWRASGGHDADRRRQARHRQNLSEHRAVQGHVGAGQHHGRPKPAHACQLLEVALQLPRARREEAESREAVEEIIEFLEIEHIRKTPVSRLPYGLQKRVELGRALAAEPKILLLDEPMAGMNIEEKQDMCRFILDVNDHYGTTIVLIEHDMGVVMDISDRVVVLDYGKKIGDGTPEEVRSNQNVIDAYLGVPH